LYLTSHLKSMSTKFDFTRLAYNQELPGGSYSYDLSPRQNLFVGFYNL